MNIKQKMLGSETSFHACLSYVTARKFTNYTFIINLTM